MSMIGWYYLHTNNDLIYKRELGDTAANIRESDFARAMWPIDPEDRSTAWRICVEAGALNAKSERIKQLAEQWRLTDEDAHFYALHLHCDLFMDGDKWGVSGPGFIDPQQSEIGFGDTALEAFTDLCKKLGYKGGKTWTPTFEDLLQSADPANRQFGVGD